MKTTARVPGDGADVAGDRSIWSFLLIKREEQTHSLKQTNIQLTTQQHCLSVVLTECLYGTHSCGIKAAPSHPGPTQKSLEREACFHGQSWTSLSYQTNITEGHTCITQVHGGVTALWWRLWGSKQGPLNQGNPLRRISSKKNPKKPKKEHWPHPACPVLLLDSVKSS